MQMQTGCGVDVSSVKTEGVHTSFNIFLGFWTDGNDDQGWGLVETIITECAVPVFPI